MTRPLTRRLLAQAAAITLAATTGLVTLAVTSGPAHADGALTCRVSNNRTTDSIRVRAQASINSDTVAWLVARVGTNIDSAQSACHYHSWFGAGTNYSCFGHPTDNKWVRVLEDGVYGYVGWRCVTGP